MVEGTNSKEEGNEMTNQENKTHYIVQTAKAKVPASCWGRYGRVAVLEVPQEQTSAIRIDDRLKDVSVIRTWEMCNIGKTERCAFQRALKEANELATKLNRVNQVIEEVKENINN